MFQISTYCIVYTQQFMKLQKQMRLANNSTNEGLWLNEQKTPKMDRNIVKVIKIQNISPDIVPVIVVRSGIPKINLFVRVLRFGRLFQLEDQAVQSPWPHPTEKEKALQA